MYKEFAKAQADNVEAVQRLQVLEERRRSLHDQLTKFLETKNKLEAREFSHRKNIDMATSDLKVKTRCLNVVQSHLNQLSEQLKRKKNTLVDYEVQAEALQKEISGEDNSQEFRENQTKIIKELERHKRDLNKAFKKKMEVEKQRNLLKNNLDKATTQKFRLIEKLNSLSPEVGPGKEISIFME